MIYTYMYILSIYRRCSFGSCCNPIRLSFLEHLPRRSWAPNVVQNLAGLTQCLVKVEIHLMDCDHPQYAKARRSFEIFISQVCVCVESLYRRKTSFLSFLFLMVSLEYLTTLQGSGGHSWSHHSTKTLQVCCGMQSGRRLHIPAFLE